MAKREFEFTQILSGAPELTVEVLDAFYEAGCDDALIGTRDGVAYADFCREADSFRQAVLSAIRDVESAGVGARVDHEATRAATQKPRSSPSWIATPICSTPPRRPLYQSSQRLPSKMA